MPLPPLLPVAVVMERLHRPTEWEEWRHTVAEVVIDADGAFGTAPRCLLDDGRRARFLFPGLAVEMHPVEAEGYYLNLSAGTPVWFVHWRIDDDDPARAWPEGVSLSYHVAGRLLDAQERVDTRPLDEPVRQALQAFTDAHHAPEPRRRQRPASFRAPPQR